MSIPGFASRLSAGPARVRSWPVWSLERPARVYVLGVLACYVAAIGVAAGLFHPRLSELLSFVAFLACGVIHVEVTRHVREPHNGTLFKDLLTIWYLPMALLLAPLYALVAPALLLGFKHWRTGQGVIYRRAFSAAADGLGFGAASLLFHMVPVSVTGGETGFATHVTPWAWIAFGSNTIAWAIGVGLVLVAIRLTDPDAKLRGLVLSKDSLAGHVTEVSFGVIIALVVALNPYFVILGLPSVMLLRRYLLYSQAVSDARVDGKTGLLNAATWEREAATEISRAARVRSSLAVLLVDIDHFKQVNDQFGHLTGDRVLRGVADALRDQLRDYDVIGRFGGEEFAILLPHTNSEQAEVTAERLRQKVADLLVSTEQDPLGAGIQVTVSIGVATVIDAGCTLEGGRRGVREVTDLLAAADLALYRAKNDGRDRVHLLAEMAGSGHSDAG